MNGLTVISLRIEIYLLFVALIQPPILGKVGPDSQISQPCEQERHSRLAEQMS